MLLEIRKLKHFKLCCDPLLFIARIAEKILPFLGRQRKTFENVTKFTSLARPWKVLLKKATFIEETEIKEEKEEVESETESKKRKKKQMDKAGRKYPKYNQETEQWVHNFFSIFPPFCS